MSQAFPPGAVGLVIAAILAASLSSIDSAINSCTSVVVVDLYNRFRFGPAAPVEQPTVDSRPTPDRRRPTADRQLPTADCRLFELHQVRVSRIATLCLGFAGTLLAMNVSRIGTLLEIASKVINAFSGPLFAIYLLAMFSRRATSAAVLAAGLVGFMVSYYVAYHSSIGFLWPSTFGLAATIATASAIGAVNALRGIALPARGQHLTWYAVVHAPAQAQPLT